ncbi:MAG: hypothetical protein IPK26_09340 [Planctomycetes bacterium]|nr:hypothetical protein [Planctomycetota bacterium]
MGIAVLDPASDVWAARPGPQDADELAAYLRLCASRRPLRAAAAKVADAPDDARAKYEFACLRLERGCRVGTEDLFVSAAMAGIHDARHKLARLHALDGNVLSARRWLQDAPKTPEAQVTEGYLLFKERRHAEAVVVLGKALDQQLGPERQRALLYYGKALTRYQRLESLSHGLEFRRNGAKNGRFGWAPPWVGLFHTRSRYGGARPCTSLEIVTGCVVGVVRYYAWRPSLSGCSELEPHPLDRVTPTNLSSWRRVECAIRCTMAWIWQDTVNLAWQPWR